MAAAGLTGQPAAGHAGRAAAGLTAAGGPVCVSVSVTEPLVALEVLGALQLVPDPPLPDLRAAAVCSGSGSGGRGVRVGVGWVSCVGANLRRQPAQACSRLPARLFPPGRRSLRRPPPAPTLCSAERLPFSLPSLRSAGHMAPWRMPPSRTVVHPPHPTRSLEPAQRLALLRWLPFWFFLPSDRSMRVIVGHAPHVTVPPDL